MKKQFIILTFILLTSLAYAAPTNPGDVDGDGDVDILDLTAVITALGVQNNAPAHLDHNDDGEINLFDLVLVAKNWGTTYHISNPSQPVFSDDFESGDINSPVGGFWYNDQDVEVVTDLAYSGLNSLRFDFTAGSSHSWREIRGDFSQNGATEVWLEWQLYVPTNYAHRTRTDSSSNNKFWIMAPNDQCSHSVGLCSNVSGFWQVQMEIWPALDTTGENLSRINFVYAAEGSSCTNSRACQNLKYTRLTDVDNAITASDRGKWVHFGVHVKASDTIAASNGLMELYKNGEVIGTWQDYPFGGQTFSDDLRMFELLGWHNAGYDEDTTLYIDDVKVSTEDPGWVDSSGVQPLWEMNLDYATKAEALAADTYLAEKGAPERNFLSTDVPSNMNGNSWHVFIPQGEGNGGGFNVHHKDSYPFTPQGAVTPQYPIRDSYWEWWVKFDPGFLHASALGCTGGSAGLKVHLSSEYPFDDGGNGRFDHIQLGDDFGGEGFSLSFGGQGITAIGDPRAMAYDGQWHKVQSRRKLDLTNPILETWIDGVPIHDPSSQVNVPSSWSTPSFLYASEFIGTYNCAYLGSYPGGMIQDISYKAYGVKLWTPDNPVSGVPEWYANIPDNEKFPNFTNTQTSSPDLISLPVASGQEDDLTTWNTFDVPNMAASNYYLDPITNVRVWKATDTATPINGPSKKHDYSEGGPYISRGWGPNEDTHTFLIYVDFNGYRIADFERGVGISNWRTLPVNPSSTSCVAFSNDADTPQIAYVFSGSQLHRVNTSSNQLENTGNFPATLPTINGGCWLHQDKNDEWFVKSIPGGIVAWNSVTNQTINRTFPGYDEPHLERDGRYVIADARPVVVWDLETDTIVDTMEVGACGVAPGDISFGHAASLRGFWMAAKWTCTLPSQYEYRLEPTSPLQPINILQPLISSNRHISGQWIQSDAELGNDLTNQWYLAATYDNPDSYAIPGAYLNNSIGFIRADGSDTRLLAHTYYRYQNGHYWEIPRATISPDGKLVMFDSDMMGTGRTDVFLVEVPLS